MQLFQDRAGEGDILVDNKKTIYKISQMGRQYKNNNKTSYLDQARSFKGKDDCTIEIKQQGGGIFNENTKIMCHRIETLMHEVLVSIYFPTRLWYCT